MTIAVGFLAAGAMVVAKPQMQSIQKTVASAVSGCPQDSARLVAASAEQLQAMLRCAGAGSTILLEPGNFGRVSLKGVTGLSLTSRDAAAPATIERLEVRDSRDIGLSHLRLAGGNVDSRLILNSSQNVTASDLTMPGTPGRFDDVAMCGVYMRSTSHITLRRLRISWVPVGICFGGFDHFLIEDNVITDIRKDGISGGGASQIVIRRNTISNIRPAPGDHSDAIQFWKTNTTGSMRDIVISDNLYLRGEGAPAQGVFLGNEGPKFPYQNVEISNNVMIGTLWNGIMLVGGQNVAVRANTVLPLPDQRSWIRLHEIEGITIEGNRTTNFVLDPAIRPGRNTVGPVRRGEIDRTSSAQLRRLAGKNGDAAAEAGAGAP